MKLLFDENLSFRLVEAIAQFFPGSIHITRTSLARGASDRAIWECAGQNDFAIVTADSDFVTLANTLGHPPKVIHLENCDYPTAAASFNTRRRRNPAPAGCKQSYLKSFRIRTSKKWRGEGVNC